MERVELAVAPLHDVSAPAVQHLHSEHLAGAGGQPGARETRRKGAARPTPGDAPSPPSAHRSTKRPGSSAALQGSSHAPAHLGTLPGAVPQEPGPPSAGLANPSGPETLDRLSPNRLGRRARGPEPGVRDPHCIRRGEIRWVPAPLPIHCPGSLCGLSRGSAGCPRPRAPPTGCEFPASARRSQPNSRKADPRPLRAGPASSSLQAPPRAFPRAAGSCKGPITLDPRRQEAGAAL